MTFPRSLSCALACAASLVVPGSASALDTGALYDVSLIDESRPGSPPEIVGQLMFFLLAETPTTCRYNYEWVGITKGAPLSVQGFVDETKVAPHTRCTKNALVSFSTSVGLAMGLSSSGFDIFDQVRTITSMPLEEAPSSVLTGTVVFGGTTSNSFGIIIGPAP